jgi:hypothetical protein
MLVLKYAFDYKNLFTAIMLVGVKVSFRRPPY